jgi:AcrR family transcriptional regulator
MGPTWVVGTASAQVARDVMPISPPPGACGGLRERKKARTREAIVVAAIDLFERQGFDATTVEDIAAAADVSQRTFFRYFDSKLDVVMAQKQHDEFDFEQAITLRPAGESPLEAFRNVVMEQLSLAMAADDDLAIRQFRMAMTSPTLRSFAREHFNEHRDEFASAFAARLGVPTDSLAPQVMATTATGALWTVVDRWVDEGASSERLVELLDEAFDLLARGLT